MTATKQMLKDSYEKAVLEFGKDSPDAELRKHIYDIYCMGEKEIIEKACEWLKVNTFGGGKMQLFFTQEWRDVFVDDFRKAMEVEQECVDKVN